jgi:hypothetical protein
MDALPVDVLVHIAEACDSYAMTLRSTCRAFRRAIPLETAMRSLRPMRVGAREAAACDALTWLEDRNAGKSTRRFSCTLHQSPTFTRTFSIGNIQNQSATVFDVLPLSTLLSSIEDLSVTMMALSMKRGLFFVKESSFSGFAALRRLDIRVCSDRTCVDSTLKISPEWLPPHVSDIRISGIDVVIIDSMSDAKMLQSLRITDGEFVAFVDGYPPCLVDMALHVRSIHFASGPSPATMLHLESLSATTRAFHMRCPSATTLVWMSPPEATDGARVRTPPDLSPEAFPALRRLVMDAPTALEYRDIQCIEQFVIGGLSELVIHSCERIPVCMMRYLRRLFATMDGDGSVVVLKT